MSFILPWMKCSEFYFQFQLSPSHFCPSFELCVDLVHCQIEVKLWRSKRNKKTISKYPSMILHKNKIIYSLSNNFKIFASWWFCNFLWLKSRLYWLKMEWTLKMRIWFEISVIFSCQHKPLRYWCFSLVDTHSIENCAYLIIY